MLVAVPPGVVTVILPVADPAGAVARIEVADTTVNVAATPLNVTAVAPVKFEPEMVTVAPTTADVGVKPVIFGAGMKVNVPADVTEPLRVVTAILPVLAPTGTTTVIEFSEFLVNELATVPPIVIEVMLVKFVPVIVTEEPVPAVAGLNEVIVGFGGNTVKSVADVAVPPGVSTVIRPVVAPAGTVALIDVADTTVNDVAVTPLNFTE